MNNLFTNGPKQLNIDGGVSNNNALKQMVDNMTINQNQINEKLEQIGNRPSTYSDMTMEKAFNQMYINPNANPQFSDQNFTQLNNMWNKNINQQYNNSNNLIEINPQYNNLSNQNLANNFRMGMGGPQVHPMLLELNKTLSLENHNKNSEQINLTSEIITKESLKENANANDVFKDIIDVMEGQDDERYQQSEFLKFIKKLHSGEIKLDEKNNDIQVNPNFQESNNVNGKLLNTNINDDKALDDMWDKLENNLKDIDYSSMEYNKYNENFQKNRLFLKENKFILENSINKNLDLLELGKEYTKNLDSLNARLAFEAEINNNPDNSEAWLLLGRIHTENDRDDLAMECFLKAVDADPFNGDALLALGISCTNEFDEFDAMIYIANWVKLHSSYTKYYDKNNPVLNYDMIKFEIENERPDEDYYAKSVRVQNLKNNFYTEMTFIMEEIQKNNPKDLDLLVASGISNFIQNKNDKAIENFRNAVVINPNDYNSWNKLGAILAHSNMNEEAINTYKNAVNLKPNYARCWSNMGLAYFNLKNYDEAIRCFLTSLKCFREINHVWTYLNSVLIASDQTKLSELVYNRNLEELLKIYKI